MDSLLEPFELSDDEATPMDVDLEPLKSKLTVCGIVHIHKCVQCCVCLILEEKMKKGCQYFFS